MAAFTDGSEEERGAETVGALDCEALAELIAEASSVFETDESKAKRCIKLAAELIRGECAVEPSKSGCVRGGLAAWQVRMVKAYIESNMALRIRIGDLAACLRLSKGHFARAFRVSFGATPRGYIMDRRMRRAEVLIRSSNLPLARIAADCGLCDQPHLSRAFRRVFGVTPNAWRRRVGLGPPDRGHAGSGFVASVGAFKGRRRERHPRGRAQWMCV